MVSDVVHDLVFYRAVAVARCGLGIVLNHLVFGISLV